MNEVHIQLQQNEATAQAWYITDLPTAHDRLMEALERVQQDLAVDRITRGRAVKVIL